ncbi:MULTISPECIES: geranylgeranylglycerol-phosphate geranylgeranyltransferase [Rufibacter]|uniref:4-hydroxybenzoate polyprenyltransferase n=1 Tax=Rufibacter quisquiliarum TaxID=1549639 RepID=A0A839GDV7_9BACT|nr:geranylgeranylglycerol-phosphate geranylgeranyltransferase [Rufibacter ruber]MBA9076610.1 4-hydroxybenzoate polyprenyltransferase [Rufibacter quisquiliarum]
MKNFLSLIRFPNLVIMLLAQLLVRQYLVFPERTWDQAISWPFLVLLVATLCVAAAGYIINDYYDLKIDRINKPDRIVVGKGLSRRKAMMIHLYLSAAGVFLGILLGVRVGVVMFGAAMLLWGYSAQFKKRPFLGNATIALLSAAMVLVVPLQADKATLAVWAYGVFSFLISLIREIIKDMEDVQGDASFRCRTLPIVLGIPKTKWVLYLLLAIFLLFTLYVITERWHEPLFAMYLFVGVVLPTVVLLRQLYYADRKREFTQLSWLCKGIMVTGICSMLVLH